MLTAKQPLRNLATKATEFSKITQNSGHYTVEGHLRSPMLVPSENPYATSCYFL